MLATTVVNVKRSLQITYIHFYTLLSPNMNLQIKGVWYNKSKSAGKDIALKAYLNDVYDDVYEKINVGSERIAEG